MWLISTYAHLSCFLSGNQSINQSINMNLSGERWFLTIGVIRDDAALSSHGVSAVCHANLQSRCISGAHFNRLWARIRQEKLSYSHIPPSPKITREDQHICWKDYVLVPVIDIWISIVLIAISSNYSAHVSLVSNRLVHRWRSMCQYHEFIPTISNIILSHTAST